MAERPDEVREQVVRNDNLTGEETQELRRASQGDDEVKAARADVELTRAEMGETVDALQEKIDPDRLKEEAKERARDTVREPVLSSWTLSGRIRPFRRRSRVV